MNKLLVAGAVVVLAAGTFALIPKVANASGNDGVRLADSSDYRGTGRRENGEEQ